MAKLRLDRIRVLVVDDDAGFVEYLHAELGRSEAVDVVGGATESEAALRAVDELRPDVVLIDVDMPGLDGVEATKLVLERHADTAIILVSGSDYQEKALEGRDAGALDYVRKSRIAEELVGAICTAAQEKRRLRVVRV